MNIIYIYRCPYCKCKVHRQRPDDPASSICCSKKSCSRKHWQKLGFPMSWYSN